MKLVGLKKAVGDINRIFESKDPEVYGCLMLDTGNGRVWVDEFHDITRESCIEYEDENIVKLSEMIIDFNLRYADAWEREYGFTMKDVQEFVDKHLNIYTRKNNFNKF